MPTYDYRCTACGHEFELFQSMSEPVKRKCPECGKPKLERLIGTGAGVLFKGGGFYETDYRSEGYKKAAEADKKAAEPAKASAEGDKPASSKPTESSGTAASAGAASENKPQASRKAAVPKSAASRSAKSKKGR